MLMDTPELIMDDIFVKEFSKNRVKLCHITQEGSEITITPQQSRILMYLLDNFGEYVSTEDLMNDTIIGYYDFQMGLNILRVHLVSIRKFLKQINSAHTVVVNKRVSKIYNK